MKLTACGKTDVGLVRSNNEDSYYLNEQLGLFIVADGMGGHAAGEIASRMAIDVVCERLEPQLGVQTSAEKLLPVLVAAVTAANQSVSQAAAKNPAWAGMGTTLTTLLIHARQALFVHIGDSRLYRWRNQVLEQLSDDHTLVEAQVRQGIISDKEAGQSNLGHILLQAIGITEDLELCQNILPIQQGDCFLLCSDGLTGMLPQDKISAILTQKTLPQQGCEELVALALAAGGKDNITAVLVTVDKNEK
jgi:protein phosphatase